MTHEGVLAVIRSWQWLLMPHPGFASFKHKHPVSKATRLLEHQTGWSFPGLLDLPRST